ncbi:MAG: class I SAM-dependent methyltransferase [Solirubrobacterales bacterium]|nr:class I SAM-dependent methyltransferase [Solirubrobacterales bacterium]
MSSLVKRPLSRRLVEGVARRGLRAVNSRMIVPPGPSRELPTGRLLSEEHAVTRRLFARLSNKHIASVERAIGNDAHLTLQYTAEQEPLAREQLILTFGAWVKDAALLERTGLRTAQPPEDVHTMARGPLAAAGGLYEADLIADALASAGVDLAEVSSALDFGCSSGRVLRVLHAAYPQTSWRGCDPNAPAIEWASANLPGIDFFASADAPPLALEDASLDLAYAISIWSHFAPELGLRWFAEMHRLIRPGGHLVCTTHGLTSVAHYAAAGLRSADQSREISDALYRRGWWYRAEFGRRGDWGVTNPDWGTAFLSPEWMLTQLCPRWRVLEFAPGRNQDNQDVYVLQRV